MGSQSKINYAYIAGFLDGDGSLMLQIKRRKDGKVKIRFMTTICFYQDSRHDKGLHWIKSILGIGYLSKRNDGMTELRVNGYAQVMRVLDCLIPFIRFKKVQARALREACVILASVPFKKISRIQLNSLVKLILEIQSENYVTKKKKTKEDLNKILGLTP